MRKISGYFLILAMLMSFSLTTVSCAPVITDAVPIAINPNIIRMSKGETHTLVVYLSKPRKEKGTVSFLIGDTKVVSPAGATSDIDIEAGQGQVHFSIQSLQRGQTEVTAVMGNFFVTTQVIVTDE